jgi:multiple sugar transport system substrate-binding protein
MTQRREFLATGAALASGALLPGFAAAQGGARKLAGVTLNVSTFSAAYPTFLQKALPEFEALTGAKVNFDTPSFPVYNQRVDLELSTRGAAYDVVNVTFIYSSRWINSGWLTPLDDYVRNANLTPADWDLDDFPPGARAPETGRDGKLYGIPWTAEALITASSRFDLVRAAAEFPTRWTTSPRCCAPSTRRSAWPASLPTATTAGPSCLTCRLSAATCSARRRTTCSPRSTRRK